MHLLAEQMVLRLQVFERLMISNNTCALAIKTMALFLYGNNNGHQFMLMSGIVGRCTSQFLAVARNWLQLLAHILLYNSTNAVLGCISVSDKVTP